MLSFNKVRKLFMRTPMTETDPLVVKLENIDKDLTSRVLSNCLGTEKIETIGMGLESFNKSLEMRLREITPTYMLTQDKRNSVTIRRLFQEGDYIDISGMLLHRFKILSLQFLENTYKGEEKSSHVYYYESINTLVNRLIELDTN